VSGNSFVVIAYWTCLHHFLQCEVHPGIALDQVAVEDLAILELHEHRVALRRVQEAEGQLRAPSVSHSRPDTFGNMQLTIVELLAAGTAEIAG
jgi:hypothetical protein